MLNQVSQTVRLEHELTSKEWFKLNRHSSGYYIVSYQPHDWKLLIAQLKLDHIVFSIRDCANIIFDAIQLSDKGLLDYETLFSLFDYLKKEEAFVPWNVANSALASIRSKLSSTNNFSIVQFHAYIRSLIGQIYKSKVNFAANPTTMTYQDM